MADDSRGTKDRNEGGEGNQGGGNEVLVGVFEALKEVWEDNAFKVFAAYEGAVVWKMPEK